MSTGFLIVCVSPYQGANPYKDRPDGAGRGGGGGGGGGSYFNGDSRQLGKCPHPFATFRLRALSMQLLSNNFQWNQIVIALKERQDALRELESLAKRLRL